ncbi:MAG TPA: hypothetical protein VGO45_08270 [Bacteroidia bacterium]|jgi:hypothetical protein|nr:hypothetical protein [Bacteroidia bacterium]
MIIPQKLKSGLHWIPKRTFAHPVFCTLGNAVVYMESDSLITFIKNNNRSYYGSLTQELHQAGDSLNTLSRIHDAVNASLFMSEHTQQSIESFFIMFLRQRKAIPVNSGTGRRVLFVRVRAFSDFNPNGGCYAIGHSLHLPFHKTPFYRLPEELVMNVRFF